MNEPSAETKRAILRRRIELWENTLYEAKVQAQVASVVGNEQLAAEAQAKAEQAIRAIDALSQLLLTVDSELGTAGEEE